MAVHSPKQVLDICEAMDAEFATHEMEEGISRTFTMGRPGTSAYRHSITWRPGMLALSGDIFTITAEHYHAMWYFGDAVKWMAGADYQYFMEKTRMQRDNFDPEATIEQLIEFANEELAEEMRNERESGDRAEHLEAVWDWNQDPSWPKPQMDDRPKLRIWSALQKYTGGFPDHENWKGDTNGNVWQAKVRRAIRESLRDYPPSPQDVYEIGIDDFYGVYGYPEQTVMQWLAMKRWAQRVEAKRRKDPILRIRRALLPLQKWLAKRLKIRVPFYTLST